MAFKGIFDGSVEIGQAREARGHEAALQQQRIAAQMAMQTQQLRAQMAMQTQQLRAQTQAQRAQLQASTKQANADRALKRQEIGLKQLEFDAGKSLRDMQQENAKLMLQQAQLEFDEDQARRATLTKFRQSAFGAGLITAALNGVAPTPTLSRINQANGVADGDPGSVVGMGGGPEGLWYDVIATDEQGRVGKQRQEVDPMTLLAVAQSIYGKKGVGEFIQMYKIRDTNNTRMNIAMDKYMQEYELQQLKNQVAKEAASIKSDTTLAAKEHKADLVAKKEEAARTLKVAELVGKGVLDLTDTQREDLTKKALEAVGISQKDEGNYRWGTEVQDIPVVTEDNTGVYDEKTGAIVLKIGGESKIIKEVTPEVLDWLKENNIVIRGLPKQ